LYGYGKDVLSRDKPYVDTWEVYEKARFVEALTHDRSKEIDKAVYDILAAIKDDDYLALKCMNRLMGRGYDEEIRAYCERRIKDHEEAAKQLKAALAELRSKRGKTNMRSVKRQIGDHQSYTKQLKDVLAALRGKTHKNRQSRGAVRK
jgi:hypothetical protein